MRGRLVREGESIRMVGIDSRVAGAERTHVMLTELLRLFEIAEVPKSWYTEAGASGTRKAVIEITYSSVYGDRWRARSDRIVPERL
jgi:hypothetical protein